MNNNVTQLITERIMAQLSKGVIPWQKPWIYNGKGACSHASGEQYSLINQILLDEPGEYITFNQVKKEGGHVKKGSKAKFIVFYDHFWYDEDGVKLKHCEENRPLVHSLVPFLRTYNVFHINQCEGIVPKIDVSESLKYDNELCESCENVVDGYLSRNSLSVDIDNVSGSAFYVPSEDRVCCPNIKQFEHVETYYSTLFHEMVHSTGHPSRLAREFGSQFGSALYSKEELVAEIGSASLLFFCGADSTFSFNNSVAYCQSWLNALKNDTTLMLTACKKAEKAVEFILNGTDKKEVTE